MVFGYYPEKGDWEQDRYRSAPQRKEVGAPANTASMSAELILAEPLRPARNSIAVTRESRIKGPGSFGRRIHSAKLDGEADRSFR
jgi:hypothetical protein